MCSVRVEGTLPGFEVKISDVRLASLIKVRVLFFSLETGQQSSKYMLEHSEDC